MLTLRCKWLFPVDRPPLPDATLTIHDGRIHAINEHAADVDLGNVALLPGFVNCHTHLDLSDLHRHCPPTPDFTAWLAQVIARRRSQSPADVQAAISLGLAQLQRFGVTTVGDISAGGQSWDLVSKAPLHAVVFHELLGLTPQRGESARQAAFAWLDAHAENDRCRPGLSPHAPYSVRNSLFNEVNARSISHNIPVAIHLAESLAELELLENRDGPMVPLLQKLGVWDPSQLAADVDAILQATNPRTLVIHGNYLQPTQTFAGTLVICPRTHAVFGHGPHPFRDFLKSGVRVALGTDSLASNPDLSVLAEARFLRQHYPDLPGATLLRMATLSGAEALGLEKVTGSLTVGKSADMVVLPLGEGSETDPHEGILTSQTLPNGVFFAGSAIGI